MNKFIYLTIATGLAVGIALTARTMSPTKTSLPLKTKTAVVNIRALESSLNLQALPSGDVDEGNNP